MLQQHEELKADLTVACMQVPVSDARSFGVMTIDSSNKVVRFVEKPTVPDPMPGNKNSALASMGIYIFNHDVLAEQLSRDHLD